MKILYGVVGEGMGHAMRSRVILEHLVAQEHDVEIMASGRAVDSSRKRFDGVNRIHGLHMIYEENRVRPVKTLLSNAITGAAGLPQNIAAYFDLITSFRPKAVISDFESWTYLTRRRTAFRSCRSTTCRSSTGRRCRRRSSLATKPSSSSRRRSSRASSLSATSTSSPRSSGRRCAKRARASSRRSSVRRSSRRIGAGAITCLVYTTGEGNEALADTLAKRASSAVSTACVATSQRSKSRATSAISRSAKKVHRRSRVVPRRHRRRRIHADGRGGVPPQADARGAAREAVRASAERALPSKHEGFGRFAETLEIRRR